MKDLFMDIKIIFRMFYWELNVWQSLSHIRTDIKSRNYWRVFIHFLHTQSVQINLIRNFFGYLIAHQLSSGENSPRPTCKTKLLTVYCYLILIVQIHLSCLNVYTNMHIWVTRRISDLESCFKIFHIIA